MRMLSPSTSAKLFVTGATVGPIVDSLHNQCLLRYEMAQISLEWPTALASFSDYDYLFCSSWYIPPLLGIAYLVLGGVMPRLFETLLEESFLPIQNSIRPAPSTTGSELRTRAIAAVATTALIIKLSEFLETNAAVTDNIIPALERPEAHILVMLVAALSQWALLDGTIAALLVATITSIGGPLSELPFVASHFWVYLEQAGDYLPLANIVDSGLLESLLGENYQTLALSSITGPCYFAVTMDAIALGRWFDADESSAPTKSS
jgi:hypothetical protein